MTKPSKKFFSLIHGDKVFAAPKTKVIPQEEYSTLLSANEILENVKVDAENYKKKVVDEIEALKEKAQQEGFDEGFKQWVEAIERMEEEIQKVRKDLEQVIMPIAIKSAKKIVNKEIELSESTIVDIVSGNLKAVAQHKKVTIYVNPQDLEVMEKNRNKLKDLFESLEVLSIRPKNDVQLGGCIIETEAGIINAQLDNRWRILEAAFEKKMTKK